KVIKSVKKMQQLSAGLHRKGRVIGLIPTMGYLHKGHLSLVKRSKKNTDVTIVSIFVNPTQFGPSEDFVKYPRNIRQDLRLLKEEGVDFVFIPDAESIYPADFQTYVTVENVTKILEGSARPVHFRGVTTVVSILFNIVNPDYSYFGQKDAQQAFIIRQMAKDLKFNIKITVAPIVREPDGLALSSRNVYLSGNERSDALIINRSLRFAGNLVNNNVTDVAKILTGMRRLINDVKSSELDYVSIVEADSFTPVTKLVKGRKYYILVACRIGRTRLIDNITVKI
ncbi:MAG TPA: pantoate--beta-alanine ligase, partial [Ignavibacteriaceae bacterium]